MRTWWAGFVAVLAVGLYLGYRVVALEQRVDALSARIGSPASTDGAAGAAAHAGGYEQRLAALERDQRVLYDDLRTLEEATADPTQPRAPAAAAVDPATGEQRILSVISREQSRIRDRQLQFHSSRWLEQRRQALDEFARNQKLSPRQTDVLGQLLEDELDGMVAIMRRPDAAENPERVADEWLTALEATDREAHRLLDPTQTIAWDIARFIERHLLWPWLPER